jgi:hypothetical protein
MPAWCASWLRRSSSAPTSGGAFGKIEKRAVKSLYERTKEEVAAKDPEVEGGRL